MKRRTSNHISIEALVKAHEETRKEVRKVPIDTLRNRLSRFSVENYQFSSEARYAVTRTTATRPPRL